MPRKKSRKKLRKPHRRTRGRHRKVKWSRPNKTRISKRNYYKKRRKTRRKRKRRGGVSALWSAAAEIGSKEHAQKKRENKEMIAIGWEKGDGMCSIGGKPFTAFRREHHCRSCGKVVCDEHSKNKQRIYKFPIKMSTRICDRCAEKEENAIRELGGGQKAILALRRAMLENCNSREGCFSRSRNLTERDISLAKQLLNEDNSSFQNINKGYDSWDVKRFLNKKFPRKKQVEELGIKDPWARVTEEAMRKVGRHPLHRRR
jgi:hypothetical protein